MIRNRTTLLIVDLFFALTSTAFASGTCSVCVEGGHLCQKGYALGWCECRSNWLNTCRVYGRCVRGKCTTASASHDLIRVRASQHPWLKSPTIIDDVRVYSQELAEVIAVERSDIAKRVGWYLECRNEVGGTAGMNGEIGYEVTRDGTKWTFRVSPGEPTLAQRLDERLDFPAQTLEVDGTTWTIKHGEEVWAQGTIR